VKLRISRPTLVWVSLALVGLVLAMGVSYAASLLSKPTVGLASEPISRVTELAPKPARVKDTPAHPKQHRVGSPGGTAPPPTTTSAPPSTPGPAAPVPDDSGEGDEDD
jgi:hypothetical protein